MERISTMIKWLLHPKKMRKMREEMEKILEIEEVRDYMYDYHTGILYNGYIIHTDKQKIYILISNRKYCCEDWGYFSSEYNFTSLIGDLLLDTVIDDSEYKTKKLNLKTDCTGEGSAIFVNLETSFGPVQFTLYNRHSGSYGHEIIIKSNQYDYSTVL